MFTQMDCSDTSFALVTRLQINETPFINEFLAYYKCLGIDRIYLINTDPENSKAIIASVSEEFEDMVEHINKEPEDGLVECPTRALSKIGETFLLHVDMDEFLYLNGMTLPEFVNNEGLNDPRAESVECLFYWVMSPLCQELYAPSIDAILAKKYFFASKTEKSLARKQNIAAINNAHNFDFVSHVKKEIREYDPRTSNCFVFHVSSRGIFDIINKIQFGQFRDIKESLDPAKELHELIFDKASTTLPNRFVLLAFQSRFTSHVLNINFEYPELEHGTNTKLLKEITLTKLRDLLGVEVTEKDIEEVVLDKINRYVISPDLVDKYAAGRIILLKVLKRLQDPKYAKQRGGLSRLLRR